MKVSYAKPAGTGSIGALWHRAGLLLALFSTNAIAEMKLNLPEPVSPLTKEVFDLHMMTTWVAFIIMVIVIAIVGYSIVKFRKSTGYEADQQFHKGWFGTWSWILVPVIVLGIDLTIAGKAKSTFASVEDKTPADMTIKVIGSQWKWTYEYMEDDIKIISNLVDEETAGDGYLRMVDNPLVLPTNKRIRFLLTASDVLHTWWVPAIAVKKDSIPGYINETWTIIEKEGVYEGQCAENCGTGHAYMPIQVVAMAGDEFNTWMTEKKQAKQLAMAEAASDKTWSKDELVAKGLEVYSTYCAACHQPTGEGIPPAFPALKGSAIAKGAVADHLDIVLNGKAGTAMSAWKDQLDDLQIAAVVTYERNAWGNDVGDSLQPSQVKAAR